MMLGSVYEHLKDVKKRKKLRSILLLSLLLHFFLLLFMLHSFVSNRIQHAKMVRTKNKDRTLHDRKLQELPAELKSRRGSLETPTFFDFSQPTPAPAASAQSTAQAPQRAQAPSTSSTIKEEQPAEKQHANIDKPPTQAEPLEAKNAEEAPYDRAELQETQGVPDKTALQTQQTKTTLQKDASSQENGTPAVDLKKLALSNLIKPSQTKSDSKQAPQPLSHEYRPQAQAMQESIQQILNMPIGAGGGLEDLGFDLAVRHGDPNKKASFEDLQYIPYGRSIAKILFKEIMHMGNAQILTRGGEAELEFTLDKTGHVIALHNALHIRSPLHEFLAKLIRSVAPFPPIPHHFKKTTVNFGLGLKPGLATLYIHIPQD